MHFPVYEQWDYKVQLQGLLTTDVLLDYSNLNPNDSQLLGLS
jgi:hypothetical protein